MSKIFTTTLRLNLEKEADRRAFDYLRRMDKRQFRSYSGAIVTAVNAYFEEQERIAANPDYRGGHVLAPPLGSREKEETFFQRVTEAVITGLRSAVIIPVQQAIPTPSAPPAAQTSSEADLTAALDFADSF